ncbi:MAG: polyphosphate kinase 1 [Oscillospiraceae bacterium]|nr:polyphosphate kinase 1 [Oscillospiraceae bacterium]
MNPLINRELSWLAFNERVLAEAERAGALPLEKLDFLAITASNLDEFFMVRVAYLFDRRGSPAFDDSGLSFDEQLGRVLAYSGEFQKRQAECLFEILGELRQKGVCFLKFEELDTLQSAYVRKYFEDEVLPVITPLAIDKSRPFPFLANISLNVGVQLRTESSESVYSVIQVPSILPRFVPLPSESGRHFLPLEALIIHFLPVICNLHEIVGTGCFRITRSADYDADEDADNLLEEMKRTLKKRRRGRPVRLELSAGFAPEMSEFIRKMLNIGKRFVFEIPGFLDLSALMKIPALKAPGTLRLAPIVPTPAADFAGCEDIFGFIRERDRMLHHPYESFEHVVDFIMAAANDPNVLAIKQTLYRVSGRSKVISALETAAESGKQVTVLVEVKARFDEENNIRWASRLERAGCHVIYGLTGLKTHCKVTLVVRREEDGIRRYLHLSTGNYNDVTARVYTDIGVFTCRPAFCADASALFNHLTGYSVPPAYNKFIVAPGHLRDFFLDRIQREIDNTKDGLPCGIYLKTNSLLDAQIINKLYEASQSGVRIKLLVRGICSLLPGIPEMSENLVVRSFGGRFLEHSRIFSFENAGEPVVYLSSADLMPRNLDRRVEVVFPIEDPELKNRLRDAFDLMWSDNVCAWELGSDSVYRRVETGDTAVNSQSELLHTAALRDK